MGPINRPTKQFCSARATEGLTPASRI
jgi:hypothetical protein